MLILSNILGFFAIEEKKVVAYSIFGGKPNIKYSVEKIEKIEKNEIPEELENLLSKIDKRGGILVDNEIILSMIKKLDPNINADLASGPELIEARNILHSFIMELMGSYREYVEFANNVLVTITKEKLRAVGEEPDKMIIQAVNLIERLTESSNAFISNLREWYGIVFPELNKIIDDHAVFARIVYELGKPENFEESKLEKIISKEEKIREILNALETSAIVKITDEDEKQLKSVAKLILDMYALRDQLEKYLERLMEDTCPNITALVGPTIGAKLIRRAGGLRQLALKPASTIQVLGAEKALFRALRGKGTPPKHGIIFTHPLIYKSPWWQRGKIARALATKLAIAARVDYFSKEYLGDELRNELMMRIKEIKKKYPKPPPEKMKKKKKKIAPPKKKKEKKKKKKERKKK